MMTDLARLFVVSFAMDGNMENIQDHEIDVSQSYQREFHEVSISDLMKPGVCFIQVHTIANGQRLHVSGQTTFSLSWEQY